MSIGKFSIGGALLNVAKTQFFNVSNESPDKASRNSYFGTPVFSNLQIEPFEYETLQGETISIKNGIIVDTVLMSVTQSKNIVSTPIQGRNGTVKEYISDGDFQIDISGFIMSESNNYPETDVNELIQICRAPVPIRFVSEFLQWFDINDMVITSFTMPQTEGLRNGQQFTLTCVSDTPVELDDTNF